MPDKLKFKIATPERVLYESEVDQVSCMTELGQITVLPNHIPLVANLKPGELKVTTGEDRQFFSVAGGFVEVRSGNEIVILADAAENAEEIDLERAEAARERARQIMSEKVMDAEEFAAVEAALEKSLSRIRIARRRKYRDVGHKPPTQS